MMATKHRRDEDRFMRDDDDRYRRDDDRGRDGRRSDDVYRGRPGGWRGDADEWAGGDENRRGRPLPGYGASNRGSQSDDGQSRGPQEHGQDGMQRGSWDWNDRDSQGQGEPYGQYGQYGGSGQDRDPGENRGWLDGEHGRSYKNWRQRQNQQFDDEFRQLNEERQKRFDTEFDEWRKNRNQQTNTRQDESATAKKT